MNGFTVQLIIFFTALLADVFFFFILRSPSFPSEENKDIYLIVSGFVDPVFILGIISAFTAFKKNHFNTAFFLIFLPLIMTLAFYLLFK